MSDEGDKKSDLAKPSVNQLSIDPQLTQILAHGIEAWRETNKTQLKIAEVRAKRDNRLIDADHADARDERQHESRAHHRMLRLISIMLLATFGFAIVLVVLGMKDIVGDVVKMLVSALLGGGFGWGIRSLHGEPKPKRFQLPADSETDEDDA